MQIYKHTQSVPSNQWVINHDLNSRYINVDVFIDFFGSLTQILPNNITQPVGFEFVRIVIDFTGLETGKVVIISN